MEFKALIPFIVFLIIFRIAYKRKNKISMTVVGLYLLSSFSSLFMDQDVLPTHNFEGDSVVYFILYTALLTPFLILTLYLKPFTIREKLPSGRFFNILILILGVGSLFSVIYLMPYAIASMSVSAKDIRTSLNETSVLPQSFLTTIAVAFPTFYYTYAFIFYVVIVQKRRLIIKGLMLLGVLSFIINVFAFAGRDGVFFASFSLIIGYFFFEPLLNMNTKKYLKKIFLVSFSVIVTLVIGITASRFGMSGNFDLRAFKVGIVSYLGMQPYIFNDWLLYNNVFNNGYSNFKLIVSFLGISEKPQIINREPYTWMFGTFLTSFYSISGLSSLLIVTFAFWFYFKTKIRGIVRGKYSTLGIFVFLGFFFHFIISGIFYFRLGNSSGNYFILISILAVFLLRKRKKIKQ